MRGRKPSQMMNEQSQNNQSRSAQSVMRRADTVTVKEQEMTLRRFYTKKEDIPEGFESLYTEQDDKWVLSPIDGLIAREDLTQSQTALSAEREAHRQTKDTLSKFGERTPEDIAKAFDELGVFKAKGETGNEDVEAQVTARLNQEIGPVKRDLDSAEKDRDEYKTRAEQAEGVLKKHRIEASVRKAVVDAGIKEEEKIEDVLLFSERIFELTEEGQIVARDQVGVTPGIDPVQWLSDINDEGKKKHWWPQPSGGGAGGNEGNGQVKDNPWKKETFNLTRQGEITRRDPDLAKRLKAQAGITD